MTAKNTPLKCEIIFHTLKKTNRSMPDSFLFYIVEVRGKVPCSLAYVWKKH